MKKIGLLLFAGVCSFNSLNAAKYIMQTAVEQKESYVVNIVRDWAFHESLFTEWVNVNTPYDYQNWSPNPTNQTTSFTQTRSYKQDQERYEQKRQIDLKKGDVREIGDPILNEQTINGTEEKTITVSWTAWTDVGSLHSCSSWTPSTSTVDYGVSFTQTRYCYQGQQRNRVYSEGTVFSESKNLRENFSRTRTGTDDYIVGTTSGSWGDWYNVGSPYNWSGWSDWCTRIKPIRPTIYTSKDYDQDQKRRKTIYNVYKSGKQTVKTYEYDERTVRLTQHYYNYDCSYYL